ncbi:transcriptional regulator [uncultured Thiothrix sp.]|uniref:helix-turn-helix domain-containing protein n=1 Tax=uncultured Thiothrix sp. TaxID=223185 RepID=UPI00261B77A8|nr:transcriptional regulator [uncultured Thiothrix sp.]HMT94806.1 transcriptional regulator [Thiolinea sp.]
MGIMIKTVLDHWQYVAPVLVAPKTKGDYEALVEALDAVLDAGGADETHPLASLADRIGDLIADYEEQHLAPIPSTSVDALKFLMDSHGLSQGDLPEVASQGVMSELLRGKRELNLRQIKALSIRFKVPVGVFID